MKRYIFLSMLGVLLSVYVYPQDTTKVQTHLSFQRFSIKMPYLILEGELPFLAEYRPSAHIGHEFSVSYYYISLNPYINSNMFGNGYKIKYGFRYYFRPREISNRTWFINPQVFFKQIWISGREYQVNHPIIGSYSDKPYTYYYFDENRRVIALEVLAGYIKKIHKIIIEFSFGIGIRTILSGRNVTSRYAYNGFETVQIPNSVSKESFIKTTVLPSFQIGGTISFPVKKRKKMGFISVHYL